MNSDQIILNLNQIKLMEKTLSNISIMLYNYAIKLNKADPFLSISLTKAADKLSLQRSNLFENIHAAELKQILKTID